MNPLSRARSATLSLKNIAGAGLGIDAATIYGIAEGGKIMAPPELSGSGAMVNQFSPASQPLFQLVKGQPTIRLSDGATARWFDYGNVAWNSGGLTVFVSGIDHDPANVEQRALVTFGPNHLTRMIACTDRMLCWTGTNGAAFSSGIDTAAEFEATFTIDAPGTTSDKDGARAIVNGLESFRSRDTNSAAVGSADVDRGLIGVGHAGPGLSWNGAIKQLWVYKRVLTREEMMFAWRCLGWKAPTLNKLLIFDGNSLTAGSTGTDPALARGYVERVLATQTGFTARNFGITGQTTAMMAAAAATQVDALLAGTYVKKIVVVWELSNALTNGLPSLTNVIDRKAELDAYCDARRRAGAKVVVLTCLPRGTSAEFEAARQACNAIVRADSARYDAIVDVGGYPAIGAPGAQNATVYYQGDQTHLTNAGQQIVADMVIPALAVL